MPLFLRVMAEEYIHAQRLNTVHLAASEGHAGFVSSTVLLMIEILHYLKDPKLWKLWYIPYYG